MATVDGCERDSTGRTGVCPCILWKTDLWGVAILTLLVEVHGNVPHSGVIHGGYPVSLYAETATRIEI